jgi:hypothetical protein
MLFFADRLHRLFYRKRNGIMGIVANAGIQQLREKEKAKN